MLMHAAACHVGIPSMSSPGHTQSPYIPCRRPHYTRIALWPTSPPPRVNHRPLGRQLAQLRWLSLAPIKRHIGATQQYTWARG